MADEALGFQAGVSPRRGCGWDVAECGPTARTTQIQLLIRAVMEAAGGGDIRLRKIRSGVPTMGGPKIGVADASKRIFEAKIILKLATHLPPSPCGLPPSPCGLRRTSRWTSRWANPVLALAGFAGRALVPSARVCRVLGYKAVGSDRGGFIGFSPAMSPVVVFCLLSSCR